MSAIKRCIVNSDKTMVEYITILFSMFKEHKHLTNTIRPGLDRSIEQNRLWGGMYKRIGETLDWEFKHARAHCKLYYGCEILKRDSDGFEDSFNSVFGNLTEEAALRLMMPNKLFPSDGFPVTRHFSTKQGSEYTKMIADDMAEQKVNFEDLLSDAA